MGLNNNCIKLILKYLVTFYKQSKLDSSNTQCVTPTVHAKTLLYTNGRPQYPYTPENLTLIACKKITKYFKISFMHFYCYTVHVVELLNYYTNHCTYIKFIKFTKFSH